MLNVSVRAGGDRGSPRCRGGRGVRRRIGLSDARSSSGPARSDGAALRLQDRTELGLVLRDEADVRESIPFIHATESASIPPFPASWALTAAITTCEMIAKRVGVSPARSTAARYSGLPSTRVNHRFIRGRRGGSPGRRARRASAASMARTAARLYLSILERLPAGGAALPVWTSGCRRSPVRPPRAVRGAAQRTVSAPVS